MALRKFATDGKLGVEFVDVDTSAEFPGGRFALGTTVQGASNRVYIYVYANEAIITGTGAILGTSFTASTGTALAPIQTIYALASGEYGWVDRTAFSEVGL